MSKQVLLTGGTGFIGQHVTAEFLSRGYEVHSIEYDLTSPSQDGVIKYELNLLDNNAVNEFFEHHHFDSLVHLAWYVGPKCHVSNVNLEWLISSLNLLNAFAKSGGKKFMGAGTNAEYNYKFGFLQEDVTPTNSGILHGEAKNSLYRIAKTFCAQNNIDFKWPRMFNLYGPFEKPKRLMPYVINACLNGEDVLVSDCLMYQDYLYVKDTACGLVDVYESDIEGAVNICSGKPTQLCEIVEKIAELTGYTETVCWGAIPSAVGNDIIVGNNKKLKSLGWKPKYTLEEGLKETINWWRECNKGETLNV